MLPLLLNLKHCALLFILCMCALLNWVEICYLIYFTVCLFCLYEILFSLVWKQILEFVWPFIFVLYCLNDEMLPRNKYSIWCGQSCYLILYCHTFKILVHASSFEHSALSVICCRYIMEIFTLPFCLLFN